MVQSTTTRRHFSLEDANATLPLVRAIVTDLVELHADVAAREDRVEHLLGKRGDKPRDAYDDELREIQRSLYEDRQQLARYEGELESLGVRLRSAAEGVIEFSSWLAEEPVVLIWRLNENRITRWSNASGEEQDDVDERHFTAAPQQEPPFRRR